METKEAAAAFASLAKDTRLETLRALVKAGPVGKSAGALAASLDTPPPTMSFHLKELMRANLIQSRRQGRSVIYAANYGGLRRLVDFLMADCCQGDPRLCGPYVVERPADEQRHAP